MLVIIMLLEEKNKEFKHTFLNNTLHVVANSVVLIFWKHAKIMRISYTECLCGLSWASNQFDQRIFLQMQMKSLYNQ